MAPISKEWLVGFIEGEGNFNVGLARKYKTPSWKYPFEFYPMLQFRIFLREDDLGVLEKIRELLGMGKIYKKSYKYSRERGINSSDQYAFYIIAIKDLLKLKEIFSSCEFHTKKKNDMEIFFKILDLKASKQHLNKEGYSQIISLAKEMNSKDRNKFKSNPLTE